MDVCMHFQKTKHKIFIYHQNAITMKQPSSSADVMCFSLNDRFTK